MSKRRMDKPGNYLDDAVQFQCWICPKCHDDHGMKDECTPMSNEPFMPSPSDNSYIAQEYRARCSELEALRKERDEWRKKAQWREMRVGFRELREQLTQAQADNERLRDVLKVRAKRSSYTWSEDGEYNFQDWKNEGSIECARQALETKED